MTIEPAQAGDLEPLAQLLFDCVNAGASIGFIQPFALEDARAFWREAVFPEMRAGARQVLVARDQSGIVGTVQLRGGSMPNQRHRADVMKLMVAPAARRRGVGRELMTSLESL